MVQARQSVSQLGVAAAARRFNRRGSGVGAGAQVGDAPWMQSPSTREAKIREVIRRADALYYAMYQSHAPEALRDEFQRWMKDYQHWVENLSWGSLLLPSTEEYAERANEQVEAYRKRFEEAVGRTVDMPPHDPIHPPPGAPFPWGKLFVAGGLVAAVVGIIYVGSKIPSPTKAAA